MRIDVEDIFNLENERASYNKPDLNDIEFYRDGKKVEIPQDELDRWEFVGLNNIDFITSRDWPE